MSKIVLIDNRMRDFEKNKLLELGYEILEIPTNKNVYYEISSHVDIFAVRVKDNLILEPTVYELLQEKIRKSSDVRVIKGQNTVKYKYPFDVPYNICITKDFAIGNFKYIDPVLDNVIGKSDLRKVHINQGYSKCSIAVIDDNIVVVNDKSIAKILEKNGLEVIFLNDNLDIKLYKDDKEFSGMNGFVGGCLQRIDNYIYVSGGMQIIDKNGTIRKVINDRNLQCIDFKEFEIIDYGGMIII